MLIRNFSEMATTRLRKDALRILTAGVEAALPQNVMRNVSAKRHTLKVGRQGFRFRRLFVIGAGKASADMAAALNGAVRSVTAGVVNSTANRRIGRIRIVKAGHPTPDKGGVNGTKLMLELKDRYSIGKDDLVVCLISGGGSSMLPAPADGITLEDKVRMNQLLIRSGAPIREMNVVRRHLSRVKGGQLAKHFAPAKVVSLIISDVVGNSLSTIASGPTVADRSTYSDAHRVIRHYIPPAKVPAAVHCHIQAGLKGKIPDTASRLSNSSNIILADSRVALNAMTKEAESLGYSAMVLTSRMSGETHDAARVIARKLHSVSGVRAVLFAGETDLKLPKNHGKGGRNRAFLAAAMRGLCSLDRGFCMASIDSDGIDYEKYAGALIDSATCRQFVEDRIDVQSYVKRCDSQALFRRLGTHILTGYTGTNVNDIGVFLTR